MGVRATGSHGRRPSRKWVSSFWFIYGMATEVTFPMLGTLRAARMPCFTARGTQS